MGNAPTPTPQDSGATATMPATEKVGLAISLVIAAVLTAFSLFSLAVDLLLQFNLHGVVVDFVFLAVGGALGHFSVRIYKKSVYYESLVNSAFEKGIYTRLEPVLRKVAETQVGMEGLESRINKIDRMVETVIEEQVKPKVGAAGAEGEGEGEGEGARARGVRGEAEVRRAIVPGTSMAFAVKSILLAIITMSAFFLMIEVNLGGIHYLTLAFFVLWWALITSEFRLFSNSVAWLTVFASILSVPVTFMLLYILFSTIFPIGVSENVTICIYYAFLWLYALLYFSWAVYETKGTLPFRFHFREH